MDLVGVDRIDAYKKRHPESTASLDRWKRVVKETTFSSVNDLKQTFPKSYDYVPPYCHVFDIANNRHRLVALIDFKSGLVSITELFDHKQYDKWKCK